MNNGGKESLDIKVIIPALNPPNISKFNVTATKLLLHCSLTHAGCHCPRVRASSTEPVCDVV